MASPALTEGLIIDDTDRPVDQMPEGVEHRSALLNGRRYRMRPLPFAFLLLPVPRVPPTSHIPILYDCSGTNAGVHAS